MALRQLSVQERAEARRKALQARQARAELKAAFAAGEVGLADIFARADAEDVEKRIFDEGVIIRRYGDEGVRVSVTSEKEADAFLSAWERAGISKESQ